MGEVHSWENHYKKILVVLGTTTIGKRLSRKFEGYLEIEYYKDFFLIYKNTATNGFIEYKLL